MARRLTTSSVHAIARAFTLVELIVVLVILGIIASMVVPRMTSNEQREFRLAVERTSDLLMMYAQRHNTMQNPVGIIHDRSDNALRLIVVDAPDTGAGAWRFDHYVEPVRFPKFMHETDVEVVLDGDRIDISEWPLMCNVGQDRPIIEISLRGSGEAATLVLQPHGVAPMVYSSVESSGLARMRQDLDRSGRIREDW